VLSSLQTVHSAPECSTALCLVLLLIEGKSWPTFAAMSNSGITSVSLSISDVDGASHCCSRCEACTSSGTFVLLAHGLAAYATLWVVCWFHLLLPYTPDDQVPRPLREISLLSSSVSSDSFDCQCALINWLIIGGS